MTYGWPDEPHAEDLPGWADGCCDCCGDPACLVRDETQDDYALCCACHGELRYPRLEQHLEEVA